MADITLNDTQDFDQIKEASQAELIDFFNRAPTLGKQEREREKMRLINNLTSNLNRYPERMLNKTLNKDYSDSQYYTLEDLKMA